MDEHKRLDELRRRVEKDPASIAFASLAEELRKSGHYDEAVQVCRAGLERHPTYLSARVTLGRVLLALQQYGEARTEIEYVLHAAPDNLLALKCMNELQGLDGNTAEPAKAGPHVSAPEPAHHSREAATAAGPHVQPAHEPPKPDLRVQTAPEPPRVEPPVVTPVAAAALEPAKVEPPVAAPASPKPQSGDGGLATPEVAAPVVAPPVAPKPLGGEGGANGGPPTEHPAIGELEDWQARIQADRAQRHR